MTDVPLDTWWARLRRSVGFRIACVLLAIIGIMAAAPRLVVAPSPATSDPTECSLRDSEGGYQDRLPPSMQHWFGTDSQGCDEFARVVFGARTSMFIGLGTDCGDDDRRYGARESLPAGAAVGSTRWCGEPRT